MKKVLSIAGSDCSGGAGIQADLKTITAYGLYGMTVVTALTAQNTTGVTGVLEVSPEFVAQQMDAVFTDIVPDSVKIGMVSNANIIEVIAAKLVEYKAKNIVVDPVMVSTSGSRLLNGGAIEALKTKLLVIADVITPNIPEAESLSGLNIRTADDMVKAAEAIAQNISGSVLIKGGHSIDNADDALLENGNIHWFKGKKIDNQNTHGTGCTLSAAIASNLAEGHDMRKSIQNAKDYITGALEYGLDIGRGRGPLNHCYLKRNK
ncbi:MAG: bifunctional hydroxymethylpyrimidine kinase/phosphomethylpyrimidine kinase [Bacillota bacterium]|nr:bifunctional hydroxymethylpyrimidine kinase/phosphomethylpyrimidine kinase [Bacillota bacterium]